MAWVIEPFDRRHDRSAFDCGQPLLNDFIQRYATQYERRRVGRTYVLIESGQTPRGRVLHAGCRRVEVG